MTVLDILFAVLSVFILKFLFRTRSGISLPPGPRALPLVGNVLDMPSDKEWLTFAQWGDTYGWFNNTWLIPSLTLLSRGYLLCDCSWTTTHCVKLVKNSHRYA